MTEYAASLTRVNSTEISVYEPDNVLPQSNNGMHVGKDSSGIKKHFFIRLPADRPQAGTVESAKIRLAQSQTGAANLLTIKASPVTGEGWDVDTTWLDKPVIEESVYAEKTISSLPSSGNYNYKFNKRYKYIRDSDGATVYFTTYHGAEYYTGGELYYYKSTVYEYAKYYEWDITEVYQYLIDHNLDSIAFWFDAAAAVNTHKYFYSPVNTDVNLLPLLTVGAQSIQLQQWDGQVFKKLVGLQQWDGQAWGKVIGLQQWDGQAWKKVL